MLSKLWVEEYRPKTISDVVFSNKKEKELFQRIISEKDIPNLLFVGAPGTGKTTLSKVIVNELKVDPSDVLLVNCSDEKIDAVRDKIKSFSYTMPNGDFKIVQLEEFDYLGHQGQALLRSLIEDVSSSCRFIATANYKNKIITPLHSRFDIFEFTAPKKDDVLVRMGEILEREQIQWDIEPLEQIVSATYPDIRKTLSTLELCSKTGVLTLVENSTQINEWKFELLPLLKSGDIIKARQLVVSNVMASELVEIFKFLYDNRQLLVKQFGKEDELICLISKYMYNHAFVSDPEINIAALFCEINLLVKG